MPQQTEHITLLQLQQRIRQAIDNAFPLGVWVSAEIGEININSSSGHCYMELIQKGENDTVPAAKVRAVIFSWQYRAIDSCFRAEAGNHLQAGMKILVKVTVNYHPQYSLSLQITNIDPLYTLGDMERQRQQTIARLQQEGVFDMNLTLALPAVIQHVAVISSAGAAGFQDFCTELSASPYRIDVTLFAAIVQGVEAERSIIDALERIALREEEFDAVVMIRGGGSRSDLGCFDSYALCSNIAQFPLPVIIGVGHDKDIGVADMVARASLKTPTATARYLIDMAAAFDFRLDTAVAAISASVRKTVIGANQQLGGLSYRISHSASQSIFGTKMRLGLTGERMKQLGRSILVVNNNRLQVLDRQIHTSAVRALESAAHRIDQLARLTDSRRPEQIMRLGFSIVRFNGKAVTNAQQLASGDRVDIQTLNGNRKAEII